MPCPTCIQEANQGRRSKASLGNLVRSYVEIKRKIKGLYEITEALGSTSSTRMKEEGVE